MRLLQGVGPKTKWERQEGQWCQQGQHRLKQNNNWDAAECRTAQEYDGGPRKAVSDDEHLEPADAGCEQESFQSLADTDSLPQPSINGGKPPLATKSKQPLPLHCPFLGRGLLRRQLASVKISTPSNPEVASLSALDYAAPPVFHGWIQSELRPSLGLAHAMCSFRLENSRGLVKG